MRILVAGAGVLGSLFAVRLHAAGHEVTLLARGKRLEEIRAHGIVLEDARTGVQTTAQVPVIEALATDDRYDLILVVVRKNQVADLLPALAANESDSVLFIGNNVAGPEPYIAALGRERVLLGFGLVGGAREDHVVRYATLMDAPQLIFGELDGKTTPRTQQIAAAFLHAGIEPVISPAMDAWLKSHWAVVGPVAYAIYACGGDVYRLARTRDARVLIVRAIREGFRVLGALDIPVTPPALRLIQFVPETVLILALAAWLADDRADLIVARHALVARDEVALLADEFQALKRQAAVWTPALDRLLLYLDPEMPQMPTGAKAMPLSWQGTLAMLAGLLVVYNVVSNIGAFLLGRASKRAAR
ncbi:MAG: hypothetical protein Kow0077_14930 [Anaerolineae bacterium]